MSHMKYDSGNFILNSYRKKYKNVIFSNRKHKKKNRYKNINSK